MCVEYGKDVMSYFASSSSKPKIGLKRNMSPLLSFFFQHPEFSFLLKERVCPLIIKLFSPSIKHRVSSSPTVEKPLYPVAVRLLRIVSVLIEKFYTLLVSCFLK